MWFKGVGGEDGVEVMVSEGIVQGNKTRPEAIEDILVGSAENKVHEEENGKNNRS
jgi:hypothetical protein